MDHFDPEVLRRLLGKDSKAPQASVLKETRDADGNLLFGEQDRMLIDPGSLQQELKIVKTTLKCRCGYPIDERMLMSDQVKICTVCHDLTCVRCWANTDQREYLKAEVRGQTICKSCYNALGEKLYIKCESCGQTLRDYYDMKACAGWHDPPLMVCPSCGIPGAAGQLVCRKCHPKYVALMEELRT